MRITPFYILGDGEFKPPAFGGIKKRRTRIFTVAFHAYSVKQSKQHAVVKIREVHSPKKKNAGWGGGTKEKLTTIKSGTHPPSLWRRVLET